MAGLMNIIAVNNTDHLQFCTACLAVNQSLGPTPPPLVRSSAYLLTYSESGSQSARQISIDPGDPPDLALTDHTGALLAQRELPFGGRNDDHPLPHPAQHSAVRAPGHTDPAERAGG